MVPHQRLAVFTLLFAAFLPALPVAANQLVDMVPQSRSGETNQDSEPTLAINPNNYMQMAGSAFTWDNLLGTSMTGSSAPIYVSTDGGASWSLAFIVPSAAGSFPTGDITLSFGSTASGAPSDVTDWLYGGILFASGFPVNVLRTQDYQSGTVMAVLDTRTGNVDQPHTRALSAIGGAGTGEDKLYVGFNNGYGCGAPSGETSSIDASQSAAATGPSFTLDLIEARSTACQDGFAQVPAPHLDGTVYAAFIHDWNGSPRLVVVRDDAWASGSTPFTALTDPSDSKPGRFVTSTLTLPDGTMGQNRLGASNVSIAVDPRDSDRVYVTYGDAGSGGGSNTETIHVVRSTDRGKTWSGDLLTVANAMNPEIAINSLGTVGVLYQSVVSNRWQAHFDQTTDADATIFNDPGITLANTDATTPSAVFSPYIGDYASLVSAGRNFYGIFAASNYPQSSNFLPGVVYQRYVDWSAKTLYADAAKTTPVSPSIDPFFFEVDTLTPDQDFYVRDWTNSATDADNGVEPSTDPVFYATSDVWNRRSTSAGSFTNDQPSNEDAGNGTGSVGDNWAFTRVHRNVTGAATAVTAHFLVSKFGTGSNFVDSTSGDPDVSFPDPDPVIMTDTSTGPWISNAYHWHLNAIAGNHLCLAVEISAPSSPYIPPSLVGETPGWPTTDLRIINDNHKAQRNMQLTTIPASGSGAVTGYGIVHNAGLVARDIPLRVGVPAASGRYIQSFSVTDKTGDSTVATHPGDVLIARGVQPGENRWIAVTLKTGAMPAGASAYVTVDELSSGVAVNGFGIGARAVSTAQAIQNVLAGRAGISARLAAGFGAKASQVDGATHIAATTDGLAAFVRTAAVPHLSSDLAHVGTVDRLGVGTQIAQLKTRPSGAQLVSDFASALNAIDSQLTMVQLDRGDPADIMQMVRWQSQLFRTQANLRGLACAPDVVKLSNTFLSARQSRTLSNAAYPKLLVDASPCLRAGLGPSATVPSFAGSDLAALEKSHRAVLLALAQRA
jgi:hypothetical protein